MTESDENTPYDDELVEVREALESGDAEGALDALVYARQAGWEAQGLDRQIERLRDDPGVENVEAVRDWLDQHSSAGDGRSESDVFEALTEMSSGSRELTDPTVPDDGAEPFAGRVESEVEGSEPPPDEDSTAREAGGSEHGFGDDFTSESNEVTAVDHESLSELDSEELEAVEHDMEGASAEFDRLPSAQFDVVTEEDEPPDSDEWSFEDRSSENGAASDSETERNPVVEKIASRQRTADEEPPGDGDETAQMTGDSEAEDFDKPESSGAMAALDTEREMQDRDETPRSLAAAPDPDDDKSGRRRSGEPTPVEPEFAASELGDASDVVPPDAKPGEGSDSDDDALDDDEFFSLAEQLSESSESTAASSDEGDRHPEDREEDRHEDVRGVRDGHDEESEEAELRPTSSFDRVDLDEDHHERESREIVEGVLRMLAEAERLLGEGFYASAHDIVRSVLDGHPESEQAQELLDRIEREQSRDDGVESDEGNSSGVETTDSDGANGAATAEPPSGADETAEDESEEDDGSASGEERLSKLADPESIPRQVEALDELSEEAGDHRMGFLLSQIDGSMTAENLLEVSSMPRDETAGILADLIEEGLVEIDRD